MSAQELDDDRPRRRNLTCAATGLLGGAGLGAVAAVFVPGGPALIGACALAGGVVSRAIASRISADDWDPDPLASRRSYVGTRSPDDDDAPAR